MSSRRKDQDNETGNEWHVALGAGCHLSLMARPVSLQPPEGPRRGSAFERILPTQRLGAVWRTGRSLFLAKGLGEDDDGRGRVVVLATRRPRKRALKYFRSVDSGF